MAHKHSSPPQENSGDMYKCVVEKLLEMKGVKENIVLEGAMFELFTKN